MSSESLLRDVLCEFGLFEMETECAKGKPLNLKLALDQLEDYPI